jgi:hypothetical protein
LVQHPEDKDDEVGLSKLRMQLTHSLKGAWFQPLRREVKI